MASRGLRPTRSSIEPKISHTQVCLKGSSNRHDSQSAQARRVEWNVGPVWREC